jgi:hypothetical protein
MLAPISPEPAQDVTSTPIPSSRCSPVPSEAGLQSHFPSAQKLDELARKVSMGRRLS